MVEKSLWERRGRGTHALKKAEEKQRGKNKLRYSKQGREEMKEAALKGESWKGKMAVRRMQKQQGGQEASSSNAAPLGQKPRTGFNVGPRLAKGSYTGKFEKIKAGLIHNAKIKKQYAKMKKREGLDGGEDAQMETGDNDNDTDGGMQAEDLPVVPSKRKGKGRARNPDDMEQDGPSPTKPVLRKRKSSELDAAERERAPDDMDSDDDGEGPAPGPDVSSSSAYVHPSRRDQDAEPKHKRQKISEEEIEQKREKRRRDKQAWGKKTRRGQPNLGSRMGVLLGKIESSTSRT